jgi:hypothetical protein
MTRSEVIKDLKSIKGNLTKALVRANKLATELEIPMHHELESIVQEVEKLLEISKTVKKGK